MLKKEYELLHPFIKEPWGKFTFKEVKKLSNKTSESYVYDGLKRFVKKEILKEEKAGNGILYSLNLSNLKALAFVGFIAEYKAWNKKHIPFNDLKKIAAKIPSIFFTLIITGSYAKNKQTKTSDIDVIILVDNAVETKKIYAELLHICEMNIPQIHLYIFKNKDFLEMLLNKEANYAKETVKNNLILYGGGAYFQLIREAIYHGFNGKDLS